MDSINDHVKTGLLLRPPFLYVCDGVLILDKGSFMKSILSQLCNTRAVRKRSGLWVYDIKGGGGSRY